MQCWKVSIYWKNLYSTLILKYLEPYMKMIQLTDYLPHHMFNLQRFFIIRGVQILKTAAASVVFFFFFQVVSSSSSREFSHPASVSSGQVWARFFRLNLFSNSITEISHGRLDGGERRCHPLCTTRRWTTAREWILLHFFNLLHDKVLVIWKTKDAAFFQFASRNLGICSNWWRDW